MPLKATRQDKKRIYVTATIKSLQKGNLAMFSLLMQFIKIVYPVLKESLLGKQSLIDALKTSKIKVLVLVYCLASPMAITYLFNKTVSLATTNIALNKQVNESGVSATASFPVTDKKPAPITSVAQSTTKPEIIKTSVTPVTKHAPKRPKHTVQPDDAPTHNLNEILNRNHEYD